jgi:hypothetical protein
VVDLLRFPEFFWVHGHTVLCLVLQHNMKNKWEECGKHQSRFRLCFVEQGERSTTEHITTEESTTEESIAHQSRTGVSLTLERPPREEETLGFISEACLCLLAAAPAPPLAPALELAMELAMELELELRLTLGELVVEEELRGDVEKVATPPPPPRLVVIPLGFVLAATGTVTQLAVVDGGRAIVAVVVAGELDLSVRNAEEMLVLLVLLLAVAVVAVCVLDGVG